MTAPLFALGMEREPAALTRGRADCLSFSCVPVEMYCSWESQSIAPIGCRS